jgi:nucleotide-binding universal stress UspA family protein
MGWQGPSEEVLMKRFRTVVVPMDFSAGSEHALRFALDLVGDTDATLVVYHVIPELHVLDPLFDRGHPPIETLDVIRRRAEERVGAVAGTRRVQVTVDEGDAPTKIVAFAAEVNADLLVIATHGRRGVERFFLGSVAERIIRSTSCPVLVVRLPERG